LNGFGRLSLTFLPFESVSVLRFIVSSRSRGEIGGEWVGVVKGMIALRSSGGWKKLLNGLNPGEKIVLQAKSSGSSIDGKLVLSEPTWLFHSEFVLFVQEGVTRSKTF